MSRIKEKPYNVGATDIIEHACYKPHRGDGLELSIFTEHFVQLGLDCIIGNLVATELIVILFKKSRSQSFRISNLKSPLRTAFSRG